MTEATAPPTSTAPCSHMQTSVRTVTTTTTSEQTQTQIHGDPLTLTPLIHLTPSNPRRVTPENRTYTPRPGQKLTSATPAPAQASVAADSAPQQAPIFINPLPSPTLNRAQPPIVAAACELSIPTPKPAQHPQSISRPIHLSTKLRNQTPSVTLCLFSSTLLETMIPPIPHPPIHRHPPTRPHHPLLSPLSSTTPTRSAATIAGARMEKENTVHTFHTDPKAIPKSWILLDSCSTVNVFSNGELLENIRNTRRMMKIACQAGTTNTTMVRDLPGFKSPIWYTLYGIANVLSLSSVRKMYRVGYVGGAATPYFTVDTDSKTLKFVESTNELY